MLFKNYKTWTIPCVDKAYASLEKVSYSTYYGTSYWETLHFYNWWPNGFADIFFKTPSQHSSLIPYQTKDS